MKIEFEDTAVQVASEDSGKARIIEVGVQEKGTPLDCFFVRLQSWDQTKQHEVLKQLEGKRLRVTIEVLD